MSPLTEPTRIVLAQGYTRPDDADAVAYIAAVEAADGQPLETDVRMAINAFVKGCKADGIWSAIKASCILAGARTLDGALIPLAGTAPTNYNFVSADYNRKTGLVGDGSTKYLNSNHSISATLQNNAHLSVYLGQSHTPVNIEMYNATSDLTTQNSFQMFRSTGFPSALYSRLNDTNTNSSGSIAGAGFVGSNRAVSASYTTRTSRSNNTVNQPSTGVPGLDQYIFARNRSGSSEFPTIARIAFYSIGEALDLALLDARVTDLINAIGVAIP